MLSPLHDRVLVSPREEDSVSRGGIIIPDAAKEKPQRGVVLAIGKGKRDKDGKRVALDVKEGDQVLFGKYVGSEVEIMGERCLIVREEELLAVMSDD